MTLFGVHVPLALIVLDGLLLLSFCGFLWMAWRAPLGFEDRDGFHPADNPSYEIPDALELDPRLQRLARAALAFHDEDSNPRGHRNHV